MGVANYYRNYYKDKQQFKEVVGDRFQKKTNQLNLYGCPSTWTQVLGFQDWSHIQILCVDQCQIGISNIEQLTKYDWPALQKLSINKNQVRGKALQNLVHKKWKQLSSFIIIQNNIGNAGFQVLLQHEFPKLKELKVAKNNINYIGLMTLLKFQCNLVTLSLGLNSIGRRGCEVLSKAKMPFLATLQLHLCFFGNEGVRHLMKSQFKSLQNLKLGNNRICFDGHVAMQNCSLHLKTINIGDHGKHYNYFFASQPIFTMTFYIIPNFKDLKILYRTENAYLTQETSKILKKSRS